MWLAFDYYWESSLQCQRTNQKDPRSFSRWKELEWCNPIVRIVFLVCFCAIIGIEFHLYFNSYLDHSAAAQNQIHKHFGTMLASTSTYLSFSLYDVLLSSLCGNHSQTEKMIIEFFVQMHFYVSNYFIDLSIQVPVPLSFYCFYYSSGTIIVYY